jgi:membrane protein
VDEPEKPTDIPRRSWGHVVGRVSRQVKHHNLTDRAATLTYYGLLALFPGLLVVVSLLGFIGHSTTNQITHNLEQVAPGSVKSFLLTAIRHVQGRAGAATVAAVVGLVLAVWSASSYVSAFMRASNAIYNVDEGRPAWQKVPTRVGAPSLSWSCWSSALCSWF